MVAGSTPWRNDVFMRQVVQSLVMDEASWSRIRVLILSLIVRHNHYRRCRRLVTCAISACHDDLVFTAITVGP